MTRNTEHCHLTILQAHKITSKNRLTAYNKLVKQILRRGTVK